VVARRLGRTARPGLGNRETPTTVCGSAGYRRGRTAISALRAGLLAGTLSDMKALVQRVSRAAVVVDSERVAAISRGLCAFIGVAHEDGSSDAVALADRLAELRIFEDDAGKMNLSLIDTAGALLVVSQFTLMADTRRGRRPSFTGAAAPRHAEPLINEIVAHARARGLEVACGRFGAHMSVELCNDGPVTLMLDTREPRS